jgi:DNA-binding NarL/FixJ family response regulator
MATTTRDLTTLPGVLPAQQRSRDRASVVEALSSREVEILQLIADGYRDREIAESLFLSQHTVANHVRNILGKLGVSTRAAAIGVAFRSGLI